MSRRFVVGSMVLVLGCAETVGGTAGAATDAGARVLCTGDAGSLSLVSFVTPPSSSPTCEPRATDPRVSNAILDVGLRNVYRLNPVFTWRGAGSFAYSGARIELHVGGAAGPLFAPRFNITQAGTVTTDSVWPMDLVPPQIVASLRDQVCVIDLSDVTPACPIARHSERPVDLVARVEVVPRDGTDCAGPVFELPLRVCCGCLVAFPAGADLASYPGPDCDDGTFLPPVCQPGQDLPLDCRQCARSNGTYCEPRGYRSTASGPACPTGP